MGFDMKGKLFFSVLSLYLSLSATTLPVEERIGLVMESLAHFERELSQLNEEKTSLEAKISKLSQRMNALKKARFNPLNKITANRLFKEIRKFQKEKKKIELRECDLKAKVKKLREGYLFLACELLEKKLLRVQKLVAQGDKESAQALFQNSLLLWEGIREFEKLLSTRQERHGLNTPFPPVSEKIQPELYLDLLERRIQNAEERLALLSQHQQRKEKEWELVLNIEKLKNIFKLETPSLENEKTKLKTSLNQLNHLVGEWENHLLSLKRIKATLKK